MSSAGDYVLAVDSALAGAVILLAYAIARTRERLSRLEGSLGAPKQANEPKPSSQEAR